MPQAIKVLVSGQSCHGGDHAWSLPTAAGPGEWTPAVEPVLCRAGWHLVPLAADGSPVPGALVEWWRESATAYLAEYEGAVVTSETKIACERCRLLRELTAEELAAHQIYLSGRHECRAGKAQARGSAHVVARDSAHVEARGSAHVEALGSAHVVAWDSAHVVAWDSAHVVARGSAHVEAWDSAHVEARGSAHVEARGSAHVEALGSAHVHSSGQSVCTAWWGKTLVLTRQDKAVIVDQREGRRSICARRKGLDGWRFRPTADGKPAWVRVKVRPRASTEGR